MKEYQIPIECFTHVSIMANSLEEAMNQLTRDCIKDYKETFSEWEVDREAEVCSIDKNGNEEIEIVSNMLERGF